MKQLSRRLPSSSRPHHSPYPRHAPRSAARWYHSGSVALRRPRGRAPAAPVRRGAARAIVPSPRALRARAANRITIYIEILNVQSRVRIPSQLQVEAGFRVEALACANCTTRVHTCVYTHYFNMGTIMGVSVCHMGPPDAPRTRTRESRRDSSLASRQLIEKASWPHNSRPTVQYLHESNEQGVRILSRV